MEYHRISFIHNDTEYSFVNYEFKFNGICLGYSL